MKLNPDYVRDILLYIEETLDYNTETVTPQHNELWYGKILDEERFKEHNKQQLLYALEILLKENFIECATPPVFNNGNIRNAIIVGLTYSGHDLLDNVRNNTVWNAVKQKAKKIGGISLNTLAKSAGMVTTALMSDPNAIQNLLKGVDNIKGIL